jgi:hypothetical protein
MITSSNLYKYHPRDFARCAGNPERTECGTCSRRADPRQPLRRPEWWIGPWVGHGPCPDRRATPESTTPQ